jgi:hypothetical protein
MMKAVRSEPPTRRRGRGGGGGRPVSPQLVESMTEVANNPNEWFLVQTYSGRGSASSAANRMRRRDWDTLLKVKRKGSWEIISRSYEDPEEGAGVWARRRGWRVNAAA